MVDKLMKDAHENAQTSDHELPNLEVGIGHDMVSLLIASVSRILCQDF